MNKYLKYQVSTLVEFSLNYYSLYASRISTKFHPLSNCISELTFDAEILSRNEKERRRRKRNEKEKGNFHGYDVH